MFLILSISQLLKLMATQADNPQEKAAKTPKRLYYQEVVDLVNKAFRSKNPLSEPSPSPEPPKETIIEITFIKRKK
jgi:hypothetical protein